MERPVGQRIDFDRYVGRTPGRWAWKYIYGKRSAIVTDAKRVDLPANGKQSRDVLATRFNRWNPSPWVKTSEPNANLIEDAPLLADRLEAVTRLIDRLQREYDKQLNVIPTGDMVQMRCILADLRAVLNGEDEI